MALVLTGNGNHAKCGRVREPTCALRLFVESHANVLAVSWSYNVWSGQNIARNTMLDVCDMAQDGAMHQLPQPDDSMRHVDG